MGISVFSACCNNGEKTDEGPLSPSPQTMDTTKEDDISSEQPILTDPDMSSETITEPYSDDEPPVSTQEYKPPYTSQNPFVTTEVITDEEVHTSQTIDENVDWEHGWQP